MPARQDRDAEAIHLARRFYTTRDTGGKRWSFRRLAEVEGTSKSRVADLIQHADDRGFVRIAVGTDAAQGSVSLEEKVVLEEGLRRALGDSVALLDLVVVPRPEAGPPESAGGDALCRRTGAAAATRLVGPVLASTPVWTQAVRPPAGQEPPDGHGWGLVLAGGRTVKACAEWLPEVIRPEAPATRQVFGIGSCSGTMLREMQSIEPDKCGAILGPVFP
ncbi:MAG: hypothetical protein FJX74_14765, partial [Armatimonadetes bacterium]|nr:hypothetical protein [Armatimonadota bacterium]